MKKIFYLYSKSLLRKLALVAILVIGGGNSAWAQKTLPYTYGFENNDLAGEGWTLNNSGTSAIQSVSGTANSGSCYFRFIYNSNPPQYLISPELTSSSVGVTVQFYQKGQNDSYPISYNVGYSTTGSDPANFTWSDEITYSTGTYKLQELNFLTTGIKYIAFRFNTSATSWGYYMYLDDIAISSYNPYKTPTGFSLNSFTDNSATFSWTAGNSETAWQFAYSTSSDFTPGGTDGTTLDITDNPYTLTGLTAGTTYYAAIRADYGDGHYSDWTDKVSFIPSDEIVTAINGENASNNSYGLFYTSSIKGSLIRSQFIIPSDNLVEVNGRQITKLAFYSSTETSDLGNGKFEVYLKEVSDDHFSSTTMSDWGTKVYNSATLSISSNSMVVTLNTPFNYNGGNLQIGFKQTDKASSAPYMSWACISGKSQSMRQSTDNGEATYYSYNPKITITSVSASTAPVQIDLNGYTTFASPYHLDLTTANLPSGLKAYKAAVDAENSKVLFTEINQAVPANTGILLEGTAGETYAIPVAASGTALEGNDFLVNSTGGTFTAEEGYTYYGMKKATSAEDPIVFATFAPATVAIPTNKAFLKVANTPSGASRQLVCAFSDNTTTAIAEIANRQNGQNSYFNLAGQRVDGSRFTVNGSGLKPGLYIINGKKVVIK